MQAISNTSIPDETAGGTGSFAGVSNHNNREDAETGTEPKQKSLKSCTTVGKESHSFVESEEILKLMTHDNMTSTSDLPSSEGAKFDINTVMKKIEKAGSSNSWAKVEKASRLLRQLMESFGTLSLEQEEIIGTSVAQCMRCRPFIPADIVARNTLIALFDVIEESVRPRVHVNKWLVFELDELLQRWRLSLSLFCDETFAMAAACKSVRPALVAVGEGGNVNNDNDEVANKNNLVVATTAVFILRSAEEAGRLRVNLRQCVHEMIKVARDRRLKFPEGALRGAVDEMTQGMSRELTKPQGLSERRTRTLESMAHPLRNKISDVTR